MKSKSTSSFFRKTQFVNSIAIGYLFLSIVAVVLEFFKDKDLLFLVKPLVIPSLVFMYWCSTRRPNTMYIFALLAAWIANLFAHSNLLIAMVVGTLCLMIYKILFVQLLNTSLKSAAFFALAVSAIPFILFYTLLTIITYSTVKEELLLYITQCLIFVIMGAYALANFFSKSRKSSVYLVVSVLCLVVDQVLSFILNGNFEAVGLLFFYAGMYLFCRFLVLDEKRRRHHDSFTLQVRSDKN
ncbi:MAG: hypothetical protein KA325_07735 [Flavobacterium sp.]|nr:hypothetical protein [Flavobacterium sp.]